MIPRALAVGCAGLALSLAGAGCRGEKALDVLELGLPDGSGRPLELRPRSAFAEYVELPGSRNELRLTFSSYELSCERYIPPGPTDTVLVVTLRTPPTEKPHPGSYGSTPPLPGDGGPEAVTRAQALPVIRRGPRGYVLPPGGTLELTQVELEQNGTISGAVAFEFPGDGTRAASSARGKFVARVCRSDLAPGAR